jgi:hypothetical protein
LIVVPEVGRQFQHAHLNTYRCRWSALARFDAESKLNPRWCFCAWLSFCARRRPALQATHDTTTSPPKGRKNWENLQRVPKTIIRNCDTPNFKIKGKYPRVIARDAKTRPTTTPLPKPAHAPAGVAAWAASCGAPASGSCRRLGLRVSCSSIPKCSCSWTSSASAVPSSSSSLLKHHGYFLVMALATVSSPRPFLPALYLSVSSSVSPTVSPTVLSSLHYDALPGGVDFTGSRFGLRKAGPRDGRSCI